MLRHGIVLAALLLSGCVVTPLPVSNPPGPHESVSTTRVVVGIVDSGVNPYHEAFRNPAAVLPADFVDALTGDPPIHVRLAQTGNFQERLRADHAVWSSVEPGRLYWFEGTRVLAVSFLDLRQGPLILDPGHGNAVASTVRNLSREAWIVMVQASGMAVPPENFARVSGAVRFLVAQPWVDIVSLSIGLYGNPPVVWESSGYPQATLAAAHGGKLVLNAVGNEPTPTLTEGTQGPPWVIAVGGAELSTHGETAIASKIVDVVSDNTRWAAGQEPDEYTYATGTSFATPTAAGALAEALLQVRSHAGYTGGIVDGIACPCSGRNISAEGLRAAMNASATYWSLGQYEPLNYSIGSSPIEEALGDAIDITIPILPTPWVQMGWGYVGAETIPTIVAALEGRPLPPKAPEAVQYMAIQQGLREAYWNGRG